MAVSDEGARRIDVFFYGLFMDEALLRDSDDERNPQYASKLRALAARLRLPPDYVSSIS